jgi:uncharacterized protein (DUF2235 family)
MAKNIAIFCDGTGNDRTRDEFQTNVAILCERALHDPRMPQRQIVHYDAGVGVELGDLIGKATGSGISRNIQEAYDFIAWCHEPGDYILVFGFSRGAYTVRSLAGMLAICGIPRRFQTIDGRRIDLHDEHEPARRTLVEKAYGIYKTEDREARWKAGDAFVAEHGSPEQGPRESRAVHFIGVWDTVRSLGIPLGIRDWELSIWPHRFHDHDLGPHVRYAYHALAIDDERMPFYPTIWNEPTLAQQQAAKTGVPTRQAFEQVWFPGAHSDVGGGYADRGLADVTLKWMIERALRADPPLMMAPPYDVDPLRGLNPRADAPLHDPRDSWWKKALYRVQPRDIGKGEQAPGERRIEKSGEADLHVAWLSRFKAQFRDYDPPSLREHPDCITAGEQLQGSGVATGPWQFVRE